MIYLPKDPTTEPGCIIRDAGRNAEGDRVFQSVLWVNGQCFITIVRTKLNTPTLDDLQRFFADFPHLWSAIAAKPAA